MATHSSILAWRIPWTEELGGLQSVGRKESDTTERLHFVQDAVGTQVRGSSLSLRGGLLEGLDRGRTQEDSPKLLRQRRAQRSTRWEEVSEGSEHVQAASHAGLVPTPFSEENVTSTTSL